MTHLLSRRHLVNIYLEVTSCAYLLYLQGATETTLSSLLRFNIIRPCWVLAKRHIPERERKISRNGKKKVVHKELSPPNKALLPFNCNICWINDHNLACLQNKALFLGHLHLHRHRYHHRHRYRHPDRHRHPHHHQCHRYYLANLALAPCMVSWVCRTTPPISNSLQSMVMILMTLSLRLHLGLCICLCLIVHIQCHMITISMKDHILSMVIMMSLNLI